MTSTDGKSTGSYNARKEDSHVLYFHPQRCAALALAAILLKSEKGGPYAR